MKVITEKYGITVELNDTLQAQSNCIAEVEFWDEGGALIKTSVSEDKGWQIDFDNNKWDIKNIDAGLSFYAVLTIQGNELIYNIPHESIKETKSCRFKSVELLPAFIEGKENNDSTLVIPYEEGALCKCRGKDKGEYIVPMYAEFPSYANMAIFGVIHKSSAIAAIIADGRLDSSLSVKTSWGKEQTYTTAPVFAIRNFADEKVMPEGIKVHYYLFEGENLSFVDFGKCYRSFNKRERKLPTLAEKMKDNPALEYSSKAISLRCRLGVKPVPVKILEQTPENQPPVKVMMSFEDVGMLVKECASQQVGPTEFNLVGWNYGGHDGAFPQLFPVEEALGGEDKLREVIKLTQDNDYPISLHDCYFDAYTLADTFDMEKINRNHDGTPTLGGKYGGGQAYQVCPKNAYGYSSDNISQVAKLDINGAYYTDVLSVAQLTKCYHPDHEMSYQDNAYWRKKILGKIHSQFGVSYSEGARDWALPELDRAYLVGLTTETEFPFIGEKVPMYQVAYHGFIIYNSFRVGVNTFPGNNIYLRNVAYGGMPTVYYHHIFNPDWTPADGWDEDLTFEGPEKLKTDVARIKELSDDVAKYSWLQTEYIDNYIQHSPTLTETVYSSGSRVLVNYDAEPYEMADGSVIPAKDFIVIA